MACVRLPVHCEIRTFTLAQYRFCIFISLLFCLFVPSFIHSSWFTPWRGIVLCISKQSRRSNIQLIPTIFRCCILNRMNGGKRITNCLDLSVINLYSSDGRHTYAARTTGLQESMEKRRPKTCVVETMGMPCNAIACWIQDDHLYFFFSCLEQRTIERKIEKWNEDETMQRIRKN